MDSENTKQKKLFHLANMLRGALPANEISYVCAEIAYLFSKLGNCYLSREEELLDYLNRIDCSYSLREDLMRDLRPRWNEISRMQGEFTPEDCAFIIRECGKQSDLDNLNVPSSLIPLIERLVSFKPGGLMADIACGRSPVMDFALEKDTELRGDSIDINQRNINFSEMALGRYKGRGRALCMSAFEFMADNMWKYDKVFCFPPFGIRLDRGSRWEEFQSMLPGAFKEVSAGCRSELIFALTSVAAMKEDGRAVVLLPDGALFNQMAGAVAARKFLLESGYLDCVISLPPKMLERTAINLSILVFDKKAERSRVTMVDATELAEKGRRFNTLSAENVESIVNAAYGFRNDPVWNHKHRKEISVDEIREEGYDFSALRYFRKAMLPSFENPVRFGDVIEDVERGASVSSKDMDDLVAHGEGVCYYLSPSHIDNGVIRDDLPEMKEVPRKSPVLKKGDIIMLRTGANSKICVFEDNFEKPVVPSANLFVCHLKKDRIDPWYLKSFTESESGKAMIQSIAIGAVIKSISQKSLEEMQVPCPPLEKQRAVAESFKAKFMRLRELKREIESLSREMAKVFEEEAK